MKIRYRLSVAVLAAAAVVGLPALAAAQNKVAPAASQPDATAKPQLPGGASALSETHGDWTVNCQITGTNKVCSLSHQQSNKQSGQRLLAIELTTKTGQDATGTLALPFGLALANGISLQIDDKKLDGTLQFNTCQAVGCLVPVSFDADINATAADTTQPIAFTISLNGFAGALARTADLSAD